MKRLLALLTISLCFPAAATNLERDISATGQVKEQSLFIPYGFYNENTGVAAAMVLANTGYLQPQASSLVNVFAGSNSTYSVFSAVKDWRLAFTQRVFIDGQFMLSDWGELDSYQDGNVHFSGERAGSHDSDSDNFVTVSGKDNYMRAKFRYLFPIGHGRGNPIHEFRVTQGLLTPGYEAGGKAWDPLTSGRTTFDIEPFYRDQAFEDDLGAEFNNVTSGVKFSLEYDNTDWYKNPSYGSRTRLSFARDWGQQDDSNTWSAIQFEYSKFIALKNSKNSRQQVIALNFWTSDVPTWNSTHSSNGETIYHRAPLFEGSTLGGLDRQRGFATNRFHDRASINYAAEYRYVPVFNPFTTMPLLNKLHIPWWQVVGFVEVGTVADNWSVSDLHRDMKVSLGAGLRMSVAGLVIRMDAAASEEGGQVQMFFGQNF
jgi:hypothetical protein